MAPIEPVFLDYSKDLQKLTAQSNIPVLYKENTSNDLFSLMYVFDMGTNNDKAMGTAFEYMKYLGTSKMSLKEINEEFYKLACYFNVFPGSDRTYVMLEGLKENMPKAMALFEEILADAQVNKEAYGNLAGDILKKRTDAKLNQGQNFNKLIQYAIWGPKSPATNVLTTAELQQMDLQELVDRIHKINSFDHKILYYGPENHRPFWTSSNNIIMSLNSCNRFRQQLSLASRKLLKIEFCLHSMMLNRFITLLSLTEVKSSIRLSNLH